MITPEKTLLIVIIFWCILEIIRSFWNDPGKVLHIQIVLRTNGSDNFLEQVLRYFLTEIQLTQDVLCQVTVLTEEASSFDVAVADLLIRDGLIVPQWEEVAPADFQLVLIGHRA